MFKVVTPVATEPVTLDQARLHIKLTTAATDTTPLPEDLAVGLWITTAREFAEHYTGKAFAPQTLEMALDRFPLGYRGFDLDRPPVASITSIKYTDLAGVEQTLDPLIYSLSAYGEAKCVSPSYLITWPITQTIPNAVRVRYVAGYTILPKAAYAALLMLITHLYENRSTTSTLSLNEIPVGALDLLNTIKAWGK